LHAKASKRELSKAWRRLHRSNATSPQCIASHPVHRRKEYGFSSLLKQKIKAKNKKKLLRHLQRRDFFLNFLFYEVFAKQKRKKSPDNK
jgi:hypothetical protein